MDKHHVAAHPKFIKLIPVRTRDIGVSLVNSLEHVFNTGKRWIVDTDLRMPSTVLRQIPMNEKQVAAVTPEFGNPAMTDKSRREICNVQYLFSH